MYDRNKSLMLGLLGLLAVQVITELIIVAPLVAYMKSIQSLRDYTGLY